MTTPPTWPFFFQAEDGIREGTVTGVQTCALPILLEVQLVNAVAPFVLNARLRELMRRTPGREKHIVNVSAMEGQFYRNFKTTKHPHTNMAKAADRKSVV